MMMPVLEIDSFTKFCNWMQVHPVGFFGILIGLIVIMAIIHGIESAFMLFVVRPRDPELYHEWRADQRAHEISGAINNQTNQMDLYHYSDNSSINHQDHWDGLY